MNDLGYSRCQADYDVWYRAAAKPDGFEYYEYCLIFVDDILCVSHNPTQIMKTLAKIYELKDDAIIIRDRYLGGNVDKYELPDGTQ
eukprot:CAMPEP_0178905306 /NCGR_PEP_ID=MMETSP0786-20121207/6202_1 /TAXON_ID=186022 /ORGANISM="Thalassionema frauenfeldii, Strain CCMP 1798" /LENGTH=85 /DNA_ID=CAMNT_0020576899 /DNA_START=1274 /DNA_END=1531 /DNA_ORIENTATION=+